MNSEHVNRQAKPFTSHLLWAPSLFATLEGPAMESSSKPSQPCTTRARFMPSKDALGISLGVGWTNVVMEKNMSKNIPDEVVWVVNIWARTFFGGGKRRTWLSKIMGSVIFERFVRTSLAWVKCIGQGSHWWLKPCTTWDLQNCVDKISHQHQFVCSRIKQHNQQYH